MFRYVRNKLRIPILYSLAIFIFISIIELISEGSDRVIYQMNSIIKLKVGSKGEIFTTKEVRELIGLKPSSEVIAILTKDGLLIKPKKSLKSFLKNCKTLLKINIEDFEKLSEEIQREYFGQ